MKITIAAIPAYGHVFPLVPLAIAAAEAGHEVAFAASDAFAGRLPVPVFDGVPGGMTLHDAEIEARAEVRDHSDPFAWPTAMFGIVMPRHVRPRLVEHWRAYGVPDLVVYDASNIGAAVAAAEFGVPAVPFAVSVAAPEMFMTRLTSVTNVTVSQPMLDPTPPTWRSAYVDALERIPIRSVGWSDAPVVGDELAGRGSGPVGFVTLGTVAFGAIEAFRRAILETAEHCSLVIVAAGPQGDPGALGELPQNVWLHRYVHQPTVLSQVDVAVHHGGTGTLLGCLAAGVPQVITPQGADQFMNAARLSELGLGGVVPNKAPSGAVSGAVQRALTDPSVHDRVDQIRDEIAGMPSPADVMDQLQERYG